MAAVVRAARIGRADVFSPCEFDLARMLRFPMIAVDFLHIAHKIHRDHETAARAKVAGGRIATARPPSGLRRATDGRGPRLRSRGRYVVHAPAGPALPGQGRMMGLRSPMIRSTRSTAAAAPARSVTDAIRCAQ